MVGIRFCLPGWGGIYPKGLIIGEIVELIPGKYGVGSAARLKPAADFARLEEALIIVEPSSLSDPTGFLTRRAISDEILGFGHSVRIDGGF